MRKDEGMTLTEFLLARIAEDEAMFAPLRDADDARLEVRVSRGGSEGIWALTPEGMSWNVLAECEAKRRIVEEHRPDRDGLYCGCCWLSDLESWEPHPCPTLRAVALPCANHPDYREEWKP